MLSFPSSRPAKLLISGTVLLAFVSLFFSVPQEYRQYSSARLEEHRSKIAKVSVAFGRSSSPTIQRAFETHFKHNAMHGYQHFIDHQMLVDEIPDPAGNPKGPWSKPAYLLSLILTELAKDPEQRLEWLFWFDADTIIANPYIPLEIFLPPNTSDSIHFMIASNADGINSGAFAIRIHLWSVWFLSAVSAYPIYFEGPARTKNRFQEQSAMAWLLQSPESPPVLNAKDHWAKVPMRWFNSLPFNNQLGENRNLLYPIAMTAETFDEGTEAVYDGGFLPGVRPWKVMRGDLLVHFPGTANTRDSWMLPWLDRVEAMEPEWADPQAKDRLSLNVALFWQGKANGIGNSLVPE